MLLLTRLTPNVDPQLADPTCRTGPASAPMQVRSGGAERADHATLASRPRATFRSMAIGVPISVPSLPPASTRDET
jgi:hypothetical protein